MTDRVVLRSEALIAGAGIRRPALADETELVAAMQRVLDVPLSPLSAQVLAAILEADQEKSYGYQISRRCGSPTGSVYRALATLEDSGFVRSHVESAEPAQAAGRPRRRLYEVTSPGEEVLACWRAAMLLRSPAARLLE